MLFIFVVLLIGLTYRFKVEAATIGYLKHGDDITTELTYYDEQYMKFRFKIRDDKEYAEILLNPVDGVSFAYKYGNNFIDIDELKIYKDVGQSKFYYEYYHHIDGNVSVDIGYYYSQYGFSIVYDIKEIVKYNDCFYIRIKFPHFRIDTKNIYIKFSDIFNIGDELIRYELNNYYYEENLNYREYEMGEEREPSNTDIEQIFYGDRVYINKSKLDGGYYTTTALELKHSNLDENITIALYYDVINRKSGFNVIKRGDFLNTNSFICLETYGFLILGGDFDIDGMYFPLQFRNRGSLLGVNESFYIGLFDDNIGSLGLIGSEGNDENAFDFVRLKPVSPYFYIPFEIDNEIYFQINIIDSGEGQEPDEGNGNDNNWNDYIGGDSSVNIDDVDRFILNETDIKFYYKYDDSKPAGERVEYIDTGLKKRIRKEYGIREFKQDDDEKLNGLIEPDFWEVDYKYADRRILNNDKSKWIHLYEIYYMKEDGHIVFDSLYIPSYLKISLYRNNKIVDTVDVDILSVLHGERYIDFGNFIVAVRKIGVFEFEGVERYTGYNVEIVIKAEADYDRIVNKYSYVFNYESKYSKYFVSAEIRDLIIRPQYKVEYYDFGVPENIISFEDFDSLLNSANLDEMQLGGLGIVLNIIESIIQIVGPIILIFVVIILARRIKLVT